jgi:hypothetical protein
MSQSAGGDSAGEAKVKKTLADLGTGGLITAIALLLFFGLVLGSALRPELEVMPWFALGIVALGISIAWAVRSGTGKKDPGGGSPQERTSRATVSFFGIVICVSLIVVGFYAPCCEEPKNETPATGSTIALTNPPVIPGTNISGGTNRSSATNLVPLELLLTTNSAATSLVSHTPGLHVSAGTFRRHGVTTLLWALACMGLGTMAGFLFGIPSTPQAAAVRMPLGPGPAPAQPAPQSNVGYRPNTNLTEISDWITKIIVGLGLINLKEIGPKIQSAATILNDSLQACGCGGNHIAFGCGLIIYFAILGFFFGYLMTRLYLAAAFVQADQQLATLPAKVSSLEDALATLTSTPSTTPPSVPPATGAAPLPVQPQPPVPPAGPASPSTVVPTAPVSPSPSAALPIPPTAPSAPVFPADDVITELRRLGPEYLAADRIRDYPKRVAQKNQKANEMGNLLLRTGVSRDRIAYEVIPGTPGQEREALIGGLAAMINAKPEPDDWNRLTSVAEGVKRLHVRYRVLQALGKLFSEQMAGKNEVRKAEEILSAYKQGADPSLLEKIENIRSLISSLTGIPLMS